MKKFIQGKTVKNRHKLIHKLGIVKFTQLNSFSRLKHEFNLKEKKISAQSDHEMEMRLVWFETIADIWWRPFLSHITSENGKYDHSTRDGDGNEQIKNGGKCVAEEEMHADGEEEGHGG